MVLMVSTVPVVPTAYSYSSPAHLLSQFLAVTTVTAISIVHNSSNSTMIVTTEIKSNKSFKLHIP